jgi:hypothetical protein
MDERGEAFVAAGSPPPPEPSARLPPSTWVAVAVLGVAMFLLGIWVPAWRGVPGAGTLNLLVAGAGGAVFVIGATYAYQGYRRSRPTPLEEMPGVEVFSPSTVARGSAAEPTLDEEPR